MRFDLLLDGKPNRVELGIGKLVTVRMDGEVFLVEVSNAGDECKVLVDEKYYVVEFDGPHVTIDGIKHRYEVRNLRRGHPSWSYTGEQMHEDHVRKPAGRERGDYGRIHAPMPGSVISIRVKEGDHVKVGSTIVVLEAMKMQNEILSNIEGVVREIRVSEGELVESGNVLVVIGD